MWLGIIVFTVVEAGKTLYWDNSTVFEQSVCFDEQGGGEFSGIN